MKKQTEDPRNANKVMQDVLESARRTYRESTEAITALAREMDAESLFITVASLLSYAPGELIREVERGDSPAKVELLAFLLYPHFGLTACRPDFTHVNDCLGFLDKASLAGSHLMMFEDFERRRFDPLDHLQQKVRIHARFDTLSLSVSMNWRGWQRISPASEASVSLAMASTPLRPAAPTLS